MRNLNFIILLCSFGSGSKLLQAHLSNVKNLFTLPAYPLYIARLLFYLEKRKQIRLKTFVKIVKRTIFINF